MRLLVEHLAQHPACKTLLPKSRQVFIQRSLEELASLTYGDWENRMYSVNVQVDFLHCISESVYNSYNALDPVVTIDNFKLVEHVFVFSVQVQ